MSRPCCALTKGLDKATRNAILLLPELYGGREVIARAERELPKHAGDRARARRPATG